MCCSHKYIYIMRWYTIVSYYKYYIEFNFFTASTLNQFNLHNNKMVPNYDDLILTGQSVDDCSSACVTEESFQCNSFEYDYNSGTCYLSHLHPDETPKLIVNQNGFDLYIRM